MAATENKTPSLADVWRILKEIKVNAEKLVQEVETLKGNYEDLKDSLTFTQSQVKNLSSIGNGGSGAVLQTTPEKAATPYTTMIFSSSAAQEITK